MEGGWGVGEVWPWRAPAPTNATAPLVSPLISRRPCSRRLHTNSTAGGASDSDARGK